MNQFVSAAYLFLSFHLYFPEVIGGYERLHSVFIAVGFQL